MIRKTIAMLTMLLLVQTSLLAAAGAGPLKPGKQDKCPVCGMFVYKYPDWTARVVFSDHSTFYFDGVKDMMKYLFNLKKYNPQKTMDQIHALHVTDYYDMVAIDGRTAHYVIGSDIHGPMGRELIPFATKEAAGEFRRDHKGTDILTFDLITPEVVGRLD